jgi:hypothetical protein
MKLKENITILISVVALVIAVFALKSYSQTKNQASLNHNQTKNLPTNLKGNTGIGLTYASNWLSGDGTIALQRNNRIDLIGDPNGPILPPRDFFDLSPLDQAAADKLTSSLTAPAMVQPFQPFNTRWEVTGPSEAIDRVKSYQLNGLSAGPIFNLPVESIILTPQGVQKSGSVISSMWRDGSIKLWAHFASGISELKVKDIIMDVRACEEKSVALDLHLLLLQTQGANEFVDTVRARAGEDVTVSVVKDALVTQSNDGTSFEMDIKLEASNATIVVKLKMQFMLDPKNGNLAAKFSFPGYRSVEINADLPWYDDLWHTLTLGNHNLNEYYGQFTNGLKELADEFANAVGRNVRGLEAEVGDEADELAAPLIIDSRIDPESGESVFTLCPSNNGLVPVFGLFAMDALKITTE